MIHMVAVSDSRSDSTHAFLGRNSCDIGPFNYTMGIYSHFLIFSGTRLNLVGIFKATRPLPPLCFAEILPT